MKTILVTGGAGYIGSHMVHYLLEKDLEVIVLDNFSNSDMSRLEKIQEITGKKIQVVEKDLKDDLSNLKFVGKIDAIIHFAALKSVPESMEKPLEYYHNNVYGTLNLTKWAVDNDIRKIVFSSTCAVYGDTDFDVLSEAIPTNPLSVYGRTKLFSEKILEDTPGLSAVSLRYFNVVGNISSGEFGDDLYGPAILPSILRSYFKKDIKLEINGDDYDTKDGTPVRDYVHVEDLVDAHFKALEYMEKSKGFKVFNIGTGTGYTLLELIKTLEGIVNEKIPYEIKGRKLGDIERAVADSTSAKKLLNWKAQRDLNDIFTSMIKHYESQGFR
jgi:UDP-glucose 4-epimerase